MLIPVPLARRARLFAGLRQWFGLRCGCDAPHPLRPRTPIASVFALLSFGIGPRSIDAIAPHRPRTFSNQETK